MIINDQAEKITTIKINISGVIFAVLFDEEDLYFSSKKDQLTKLHVPDLVKCSDQELEYSDVDDSGLFQILRCQNSFISKNMNFFR